VFCAVNRQHGSCTILGNVRVDDKPTTTLFLDPTAFMGTYPANFRLVACLNESVTTGWTEVSGALDQNAGAIMAALAHVGNELSATGH